MRINARLAVLGFAAVALSGCVVQPIDGPYQPQPQPPVYQPPQPPVQRLQLEGPWQLRERGQVVRRVDVRRVRGGIEVDTPRGRDFARRMDWGVFQDDRGRNYRFFSGVEGEFENPRNGRRLRMRRP